ncbi:MAG: DUF2142 domain-containing protein [Oscillospiraceae bacterium]|nr:DUF2142 domain-containing protein [Oscillospiraceae bacterium]
MKIKSIFQRFRHLFILTAIVIAAAVCMAWVGYDTVRESVGLGYRQIVNDEYSVISDDISNGIVQPITVKANTNFYGVNINLHTYNRVVFGKIFVELWDADGNVLAVVQDDMTNIKDNTFMCFDFDGRNFKSEEDKEYQLVVYTRPETQEDKVAVWQSAETVEGYKPMTYGGEETAGTLALQYIVKYVTKAIWNYYFVLCALMLILLVGAYLLIFVKKVKVSTAFVFIAAVLGIIFSLYTPVKGAPDEYIHITTAYSRANSWLGYDYGGYYEGTLLMRESDAIDWMNPVNYNAFELHDLYENFEKTEKTDNLVFIKAGKANMFPPLYWAQAAGICIAKMLGVSFSMLIVMGRLANLALYIGMVYLAIRRMPFFKTTMAVIALTPVPLQLAASFSYDTFVTGLCFLFIASVLQLVYSSEKVTVKDTATLALLAALIAPGKTIYILVVALVLAIPVTKFGGMKKAVINISVIAVAAVVMWLCYNQNVIGFVRDNLSPWLGETQKVVDIEEEERKQLIKDQWYQTIDADVIEIESESDAVDSAAQEEIGETGITAAGDSLTYYSIGYILNNIPKTVKLFVNTLQENTELYIRQIFGGIFGEAIVSPVKINWLYVFAVIAIVFMSTLLPQGEHLVYRGKEKWWCFAVAVAIAALVIVAGIMWTPVNYTTIFGIQGRYIIPVLPLIVMFFANENITLKKKIDDVLLFAICAVNVLMLLDGLTIMLANTIVYY